MFEDLCTKQALIVYRSSEALWCGAVGQHSATRPHRIYFPFGKRPLLEVSALPDRMNQMDPTYELKSSAGTQRAAIEVSAD
jgi:hypothetical protein